MRVAVLGFGVMVLVAAGCGSERTRQVATTAPPAHVSPKPKPRPVPLKPKPAAPRCSATTERSLTSARSSYAGFAPDGAVAYRAPGGAVVARFGRENVNGYPTYFGVLGKRVAKDCRALWYRVQLPIRPNGAVGFVRASAIELGVESAGNGCIVLGVAHGLNAEPSDEFFVNDLLKIVDGMAVAESWEDRIDLWFVLVRVGLEIYSGGIGLEE